MASCSSDMDNAAQLGDKFAGNVVLSAEGYEFEDGTRTSLTNTGTAISFAWKNGEAIGIFRIAPTTNSQAKQTLTTDADGLNAEFKGAGWALLKGNTYAAYSPFKDMLTSVPYSAVPVTMTGQKQTGNASLKHIGDSYDYMYAKADVPSDGGVVTFGFEHVGAIAMLQLTMPEDASWKSATLTSESSVFISSCTMNVSNGSLANKVTSKSQTLELASISGKDITLYMAMLPCTTGDLTLTVTSSTSMEYTAKLTGKTLVAGKAYKWEASPKGATINYGEAPANAQAVDLGLPSGLKWANMNVGATKPEGKGTYFAWGEVTGCEYVGNNTDCTPAIMDGYPSTWKGGTNSNYVSGNSKTNFSWTYYKWSSNGSWTGMTKYTYPDNQTSGIWYNNGSFVGDSKTTLDPEDDAATVNWGGDWRMPTYAEQTELRNNCYWVLTSSYNGTGVPGYIVYKALSDSDKGKVYSSSAKSGYTLSVNHIFLPAAGYRGGSSFSLVGSDGGYWSASLLSGNVTNACVLYFYSGSVGISFDYRYFGQSVRAVCR